MSGDFLRDCHLCLPLQSYRIHALRRSADGHRCHFPKDCRGRQKPGPAGGHRLGQDLYHGQQVIARVNRPALVLAPNKTLAAQLYNEFRQLFPENAVEYFVSYYDYYQPEAYIPTTDTYIQKDSSINEMIDKLRHSATRSVLSRTGCRRGGQRLLHFWTGRPGGLPCHAHRHRNRHADLDSRASALRELVSMHYERNDMDFHRGVFRVRGDRVEIFPAYEEERAVRVELFRRRDRGHPEIRPAARHHPAQYGKGVTLFPASHYVTGKAQVGSGHQDRCRRDEAAGGLLPAGKPSASRPSASKSAPFSTWK